MTAAPTTTTSARETAFALRLAGIDYRAIARELGVSVTRVTQYLEPPPVTRRLAVQRAGGRCDGCAVQLPRGGHVHPESYADLSTLQWLCLACHRALHPPVAGEHWAAIEDGAVWGLGDSIIDARRDAACWIPPDEQQPGPLRYVRITAEQARRIEEGETDCATLDIIAP
jgi:hypothetical protein